MLTARDITMDSVYSTLKKPKQWCTKLDFTNAYDHFELAQDFRNWFGILYNGVAYRWIKMPLGWNMSVQLC